MPGYILYWWLTMGKPAKSLGWKKDMKGSVVGLPYDCQSSNNDMETFYILLIMN